MAVNTVAIAFDLIELSAPSAFEGGGAIAVTLSNTYAYFHLLFWVFVFTWIATLWLTYRLVKNLHALAPGKLNISPTYTVGIYFVPFANLFMPPIITDDIRAATLALAHAPTGKPSYAGWWWCAVIVSSILTGFAESLKMHAGVFDTTAAFDGRAYESALWIDAAGNLVSIVALALTLRIFGSIARAQSLLISGRAAF